MEYPETIYHYTSIEKLFLILGTFQLKMNALKNVNDPREKMKYLSVVNIKAKNAYKGLQILHKRNPNLNTITCFSGDSNETKGFDLPTMWAHYGDNHKGVALKISTYTFIKENNKSLFFNKVRYEKPAAKITFEGEMTVEELVQLIFFTKRPDWDSEQEWRLLSLRNQGMCNIQKSLNAIILGLDFNYSFLPSIKKLLKEEDIIIQQLKLDNDTQCFYIETIE